MDSYSKSRTTNILTGGYSTYSVRGNIQGNASGAITVPASGGTSFTSSLSGFRNPRWRSQVRLGQSATTTLVATDYLLEPIYVDINVNFGLRQNPPVVSAYETHQYTFSGFISPGTLNISLDAVPSSVVTEVTNRCIRKFIAAVNSARTSGNLTGRSIKHLQHDLHSVANPLHGLRSRISGYLDQLTKVGSYTGHSKSTLLRDVRDAYLEFEFGLRPFSEDLTEILIDISRKRDYDVIPVQGSGRIRFAGTNGRKTLSTSDVGYATYLQPVLDFRKTSEFSVRYKGAVRTGRNASGRIGWFQDNRLLPRDWLPTLVSILPYDWLVNYFINVNDLVDGISFVFADLAWAQKTSRNEATILFDNVKHLLTPSSVWSPSSYNIPWNATTVSGGSSTFVVRSVNRSALSPTDLVPRLTFKVPTKPLQYLNMLAAFLPRISKVVSLFT